MTAGRPEPVPQRACLVLASTGAHDSRSHRIADSLAARGHGLTILARAGADATVEPASTAGGVPIRRTGSDPWATLPGTARRVLRPLGRVGRVGPSGPRRMIGVAAATRAQATLAARVAPVADVYHGMGFLGIPVALAVRASRGGRAVYDVRDIYVDARNLARLPGPARRALAAKERRWARDADALITVNEAYRAVLRERFGRDLEVVVNGVPIGSDLPAPGRRFHEALGLAVDERVVLYHGGLSRDRGIEPLLAAVPRVERATLVLMGYGDLEPRLRSLAADPASGGRVRLLPAVPPAELLGWVASADVAAMPIQPTTLNHRLTTPNKLFEAMAAGVPVVASDLPGMAGVVREADNGLLVAPTDVDALAAALRAVLDAPPARRAAWIEGGRRATVERYAWERQLDRLLDLYGRLTGRPW
jgi:glycosyltransferase involved in cell wall biosynthesis